VASIRFVAKTGANAGAVAANNAVADVAGAGPGCVGGDDPVHPSRLRLCGGVGADGRKLGGAATVARAGHGGHLAHEVRTHLHWFESRPRQGPGCTGLLGRREHLPNEILLVLPPRAFARMTRSSKMSGGYDDGQFKNRCVYIQRSFRTPAMHEFVRGPVWRRWSRWDVVLHRAAKRSLDLTIASLGRARLYGQLEAFRTLQRRVVDACSHQVVLPCDASRHGRAPSERHRLRPGGRGVRLRLHRPSPRLRGGGGGVGAGTGASRVRLAWRFSFLVSSKAPQPGLSRAFVPGAPRSYACLFRSMRFCGRRGLGAVLPNRTTRHRSRTTVSPQDGARHAQAGALDAAKSDREPLGCGRTHK
jgi:hypothetical protein